LCKGFERAGYRLQTTTLEPKGLIEVYPHPALVELSGAAKRLPYKVSKVRRYWPELSREQRRERLVQQWSRIVDLLENEIVGVAEKLPLPGPAASTAEMKAYEDGLDATICAWVGICALERRAQPFGDEESAIWIPMPRLNASDH
jgi:predicted RNase H-like nuclease